MPNITTSRVRSTTALRIANHNHRGLSTADAQARLKQFGPNAVVEEKAHPLRAFIKRFWAPIPWLLEATIIIQLFLGEGAEAAVIGGLLVLNATLSLLQEGRAQQALALLRQQLRVLARVRRDRAWTTVPAEELAPGDVIHLCQGSIVPADVTLEEGSLLVDQSALTGESAAASVESGKTAYAGSMVRGGEATGEVTATGARTFFGKTAELVRTAGSANRQEHEIVGVVKNLFVVNAAMVVVVIGYAHHVGMSLEFILPLLLTILLASIPVALPATFTLAAALGSVELSKRGVLITRLSALHDIASMTVLCSDKTGTLTRNQATVNALWPAPGASEEDLLRAAALASDPAGQDPVDGAIIKAAAGRGWQDGEMERIEFKPFDPATKRAEAVYRDKEGSRRFMKAAAAMVLTRPGLGGVVPAIETSRLVFQRIITYTLNMLIKKIEIMALLVIGFLVTRHKPLTPLLMVLFLFLNDFLTMSLSTDRMQYSRRPNRWHTRGILLAATVLAACKLVFSLGVFLCGYRMLRLDMPHLQTLMFATLILSSQAGVYLLRERGHFWQSRPSRFLVGSSVLGLGVTAALVLGGILMPALSAAFFLGVAGAGIVYFACLDWLKVWLFGRLNLR